MNKYYTTAARSVAVLDNNGKIRHAVYERARVALITHLKGHDPPLAEADIERERQALEEAISLVEAEAIQRQDAQRANAASAAPLPDAPPSHQGDALQIKDAASPAPSLQTVKDAPPPQPSAAQSKLTNTSGQARPGPLSANPNSQDRKETQSASAGAVVGDQLSCRLQAMIQAARYQ